VPKNTTEFSYNRELLATARNNDKPKHIMTKSAIYTISVKPSSMGLSHANPEFDDCGEYSNYGHFGNYAYVNSFLRKGYYIENVHQSHPTSDGYIVITIVMKKE
jgi:hypothetical protein